MAGTVGSVSVASPDAEFVVLCDDDGAGNVTAFVRRFITSPTGSVSTTDTELDGVTPYAPAGTVGLCTAPVPDPVDIETHGAQDTDWTLAAHPGAQSVTLVVYQGTVTVTTPEGSLTVPAGTTLTWGVDGEADGQLSGTLAIDGTAPAASWHVIWTETA